MPQYYINKNQQANGDYEVHQDPCTFLPEWPNRVDLGYHLNCHTAVAAAKTAWPAARINGCYYCSNPCHTT